MTTTVLLQAIATSGAFHWESFKIGVENFLVVANCNDGNSTAVVSTVYKWQGLLPLVRPGILHDEPTSFRSSFFDCE